MKLATSNCPLVRVPVLSVNKMLRLPAVSIPTNFLTRTLFFNIFFIFEDRTRVIIMGRPSGTATTIIVTLSVKAYRMCLNINGKFVSVFIISDTTKLFSTTTCENKYEILTKAALM